MLLTRQQLITLSGLSDEDISLCEDGGLVVISPAEDGEECAGYRHVELTKLHIIRQVAEASGGVEEVVRTAQAALKTKAAGKA